MAKSLDERAMELKDGDSITVESGADAAHVMNVADQLLRLDITVNYGDAKPKDGE